MTVTETFIAGWHSTNALTLDIDSDVIGRLESILTAAFTPARIELRAGTAPTHELSLAYRQLIPVEAGIKSGALRLGNDWGDTGDYTGGIIEMQIPLDGGTFRHLRVFLPSVKPTGYLYIAEDGSLYDSATMNAGSFIAGRALTVEEFYGVNSRDGKVLDVGYVQGFKYQQAIVELKKRMSPIYNTEDEIYRAIYGEVSDTFTFDYANTKVLRRFAAQIVSAFPSILTEFTPDVPITLSAAISNDTARWQDMLILVDGKLSWQGRANTSVYDAAISTLDPELRKDGYITLAASNDNDEDIEVVIDRVMLTITYNDGDPIEKWLALPKGRMLKAGEVLYFDKWGNCYSDYRMTPASFLAGFAIEQSSRFGEGAIANELELANEYGQSMAQEFSVQSADGYELDHLGRTWFGIDRLAGESDTNYIRRLVATVAGGQGTVYALYQTLRIFSDYVLIQEGLQGFGYIGHSFFGNMTGYTQTTGALQIYVTPSFCSRANGGLLYMRITIAKTAITDNVINAKFIYDLVRATVAAGVGFEIMKIVV